MSVVNVIDMTFVFDRGVAAVRGVPVTVVGWEAFARSALSTGATVSPSGVSKTTISSLRRFKDDVAEVTSGLECGVLLADTNDIKPGDSLEVFEVEERARTL